VTGGANDGSRLGLHSVWSAGATRCVAVGCLCFVAALIGQIALVYCCYDGNWTALFMTGGINEQPPQLAGENIYIFEGSAGYDGQFYHYVAHDPFRRNGIAEYVDVPGVRYQRILVPLCAWLLAGGSDERIDVAYYAVVLLFVFLGGFWSSRFAVSHGRHPFWGLVFLLVPSVLISLERLTVDVALAAFTAGFAVYATRGPVWKVCLILAAAVFTRETGLFLVGGYALSSLIGKQWVRVVVSAAASLPGLYWIRKMSATPFNMARRLINKGGASGMSTRYLGLLHRIFDPIAPNMTNLSPAVRVLVLITDEIAWTGMALASVLGIRMAIRKRPDPLDLTAATTGFVALFVVGAAGFFYHPVAYTRSFTPLFVILGLRGANSRRNWFLLPLLMNDLRLVVEWGPRLLTIFGLSPA